jgi:hypothetical protein
MRLFANEPGETEKAKDGNFVARQWTQGEALRIVFSLMGFVGVLAGVYAFATAVS